MKTQDSSHLNPHLNPPAAGEAAHTFEPLSYFVGNANGRGLIRLEVLNTGEHVASMPRGKKSEAWAAFIVRACNSHAGLVANLAETVRSLEWVVSAFPDIPANCNFSDVLSEARAALHSAKE